MSTFMLILRIFVYVVIVCPVVWSHTRVERRHVTRGQEHLHKQEPPCASCPRNGRCVPKVQCPAHLRPGSNNPSCHMDNFVGVCCLTGRQHAGEHERKSRTSSISVEDIKLSHDHSRRKLAQWMSNAEKLADKPVHTIVNTTTPSFGHHLSVVTYDPRANKLGRGGLMNLFAAQDLKARDAVTDDDLLLGLTGETDGPFCFPQPVCQPNSRYRSISGECNSLNFPTWGAVHTGFERLLPPDYNDGTWAIRKAKSGLPLPSARLVSSTLLLDGSHPSPTHNLMFMQFGQFIAHDTSAGVVFNTGNGSAISCCTESGSLLPPELQHFACAPIVAATDDPFYSDFGQTCLNFVRVQIAPASDCSIGYGKQMNGVTHFADLSHIYGSSREKLSSLRAAEGLLNTFNDYGRELPPLTERKECMSVAEGAACFESGDNHGNQIISLTVLHTIFTREHNRIAKALAVLNPGWDEDTVFFEARRILQAEFQHIIYNEWLPLLLGPQLMNIFNLSPAPEYASGYDPGLNPSLTSEFSTAAMRFGHSVIDGKLIIPSPARGGIYETISIPEVMFQPTRMRLKHFLDRLLIGLASQPMQTVDPFVTEGLTRYMFHGGNPYGIDLASINIQRGRDHGVRSYNDYRRLIGLQPYLEFQEFSLSAAQRLSTVYERPEDIDLWIGGLLEEPVEGGIVGPVFANIIADQFAKLKRGDRYFYEYGPDINPGAFTPSQLAEIKKVTISRLICDNSDGIELFSQPPAGFLRADLLGNEQVPCSSARIPSMDLNRFKEM
ncbi:unnamed protein product [Arctia plantaginis]|uniref:Chorion peroxidase n=1 Tax=Arctia plantaginis TaxID=874455 RepID=A0A8S0ZPS7_ARCPL|nr:unnamed protein product [Arctia plantaginis]